MEFIEFAASSSHFLKMTVSLGRQIMLILLEAQRLGYKMIFACFVNFMFCFNSCLKCRKIKEEKTHTPNKKTKERMGGEVESQYIKREQIDR